MSEKRSDFETRFKSTGKGVPNRIQAIATKFPEEINEQLRNSDFIEEWRCGASNFSRSDLIRAAVTFYLNIPEELRARGDRDEIMSQIIEKYYAEYLD